MAVLVQPNMMDDAACTSAAGAGRVVLLVIVTNEPPSAASVDSCGLLLLRGFATWARLVLLILTLMVRSCMVVIRLVDDCINDCVMLRLLDVLLHHHFSHQCFGLLKKGEARILC